jgi:preprotein translocase subunit SecD
MSNLKYRIIAILALCALSIWALFPRNVTVRQPGVGGVMTDVVQRRVPLRRGLDLQGGTYLALEVDESKQAIAPDKIPDAISRALKTVRNRIEGIGVSEAIVQSQGNDRIVVQIPGIQDPEHAKEIVKQQAFLEFRITDKTQALERVLPRLDQIIREKGLATATPAKGGTAPAQPSVSKGLQGLLVGADTGKTAKKDSTKADSTKTDTAAAALPTGGPFSSLIQQSPSQMPGEYLVESQNAKKVESFLDLPEIKAAMPPGKEMLPSNDSTSLQGKVYKEFYMVDAKPIITGDYLTDARPSTSQFEGTVVQFTLDNVGGRRFKAETGRHVHDYMAIVLDGRVMGRPPIIQSAIGTNGQITMGGRDIQAAQDLALVLRAGALPVPLRVAEVRNIGPSLGQDSINKGFHAGAIAIALVVFIMLFYYRFSGALAVAGLALYVLYTLAILAGFDAVLTLPGLAGFVLSIGIAVDANVLIFERIREELDRGKTVRTAIDEGFRHAMPAIIDSNVSTVLTAAVLYQYGTGPVKGFAVTLIAGIAASLFTSIFVVRTFYMIWLNRSRGAQTLSI